MKLNSENIGYHAVCLALQATLSILLAVCYITDRQTTKITITYFVLQPINLLVMMWLIIKMMHRSTEDTNVRLCADDEGHYRFIEDNSASSTKDATGNSN